MKAPQQAVLLRIYTGEDKREDGKPLYEAIVQKARNLGVAGATVLRGPIGFGESHTIHRAKLVDIQAKLPLVIEIVDAEEMIQRLIEALGEMHDIGLVTTEAVRVVHYGKTRGG